MIPSTTPPPHQVGETFAKDTGTPGAPGGMLPSAPGAGGNLGQTHDERTGIANAATQVIERVCACDLA